jgi:5-methylcytosine-specific restriction protein A
LRSRVFVRDKGACRVCGEILTFKKYVLGHLVDEYRGGESTLENLVTMCSLCNNRKPHHLDLESAWLWVNSGGADLTGSQSRFQGQARRIPASVKNNEKPDDEKTEFNMPGFSDLVTRVYTNEIQRRVVNLWAEAGLLAWGWWKFYGILPPTFVLGSEPWKSFYHKHSKNWVLA